LTISTAPTLPGGTIGVPYSQTLIALGGKTPVWLVDHRRVLARWSRAQSDRRHDHWHAPLRAEILASV
jgi:hypothetical protein